MTYVIDRKNRRALTLPSPGGAVTLAFLRSVALLLALWCAMTGGGRRFRRLTLQDSYERDLLEAAVAIVWRKGRFAHDNPLTAIKRVYHLVIGVAWHAEVQSRQAPMVSVQRWRARAAAPLRAAPRMSVTPDDSS